MATVATFRVRSARPADGPAVVALVRGLAAFERLPPPDDAAAARLVEHAFGPRPRFDLLVAEVDDAVRAYALFFETYSTFRAAPSLFLEDLFVDPGARRRGIGRAMMHELARVAVGRGCERFEWTVLDWNADAQRFYRSLGAHLLGEWEVCRLEGDALARLAAAPGAP
jgi:GNAT superfamily N-acetyltransferase